LRIEVARDDETSLLQLCQLAVEMRERSAQRFAAAVVRGRLDLAHDASARELEALTFLAALDLMNIDTLAASARLALILDILTMRLNGLAFESSCHSE
jgi:hypothetical protein